jgi:glycerol-3-phosphate dehydrogenase
MILFSSAKRNQYLDQCTQDEYDLIIIGGGITGAGVFVDSVARGLKVLLVEKEDFASGTSSKSTKLIHGGLRYLKQKNMSLVKEVGRERNTVFQNARHLVHPERLVLPIYKKGSYSKLMLGIALKLYDKLIKVNPIYKHQVLSKEEASQLEPLLSKEKLKGAGTYYEYRTDDARLVIEIIKKGVELGGTAINYTNAKSIQKLDNGWIIDCDDSINEKLIQLKSKCLVNAGGPWADKILALDEPNPKNIILSKGVHIVIPKNKLPINNPIYFDHHDDDRMVFAIPREDIVYLGSTDTFYHESADELTVTEDEKHYLIKALNHTFDVDEITSEDIISSWAGLRPLIFKEGKEPGELSRKDEIFISQNKLITIAGGKLTGYRKMAERTVNKVVEQLLEVNPIYRSAKICTTAQIRLSGGNFHSAEGMRKSLEKRQKEASLFKSNPDALGDVFWKYGSNIEAILGKTGELNKESSSKYNLLKAEAWYSIHYEMCTSLSDFYIRRTGKAYFNPANILKEMRIVLPVFEKELNWTKQQSESFTLKLKKELELITL